MTTKHMLALTGLALLLALGACGKKGPLEPPPGMDPAKAAEQQRALDCARESRDPEALDTIDAGIGGGQTGNTNTMPDKTVNPC
tara:strand:+ start:122723 stop:122974 length:252 start_codon:yes stop_codon:yes gene_type:complete